MSVAGRIVRDPERPTAADAAIAIDGETAAAPARQYLMLNKPRGLVTSVRDEQGRDTVYRCFDGSGLPWLAPVGRLDKASEGLLLFSNDPAWAARITEGGPDKVYHVQVDGHPDPEVLARLVEGVEVADVRLRAKAVRHLRSGEKNAWLEVVLDEGRNRQIRRLLEAFDFSVLRLVRVRIGALELGDLPRGGWRHLSEAEVAGLAV